MLSDGNELAAPVLALVAAPAPPREGTLAADDGARLFYRIEGAGARTLVVVHGGPGNSLESVRLDLAPLARGRRVIYYDQRGNGRSELIDREDRLAIGRHVADLEAIRRHFGLRRMVLLGNSWGGLLVSAYAAAHPDRVERMILHAPASGSGQVGFRRWARAADPSAWLFSPDPVATVAAPVLVIHGAADVIPLAASRDWAAHYPDGRLLVIERAGHLVHVERPDAFFPAVEAFLAGRWPEGAAP